MTRIKRVLFGAAVLGGAAAAIGFVRKLIARAEIRHPGVYVEETPTGTRPIEGVGRSTAGFAGTTRRKASTRRRAARPKS